VIEGLMGAAFGALTIVVARIIRGERWVYSIGLLSLPSLYALFALRAGEPALALKEMLYGIPFLAAGVVFTFASVRHSAVMVGALWIAHGVFDLTQDRFLPNPGVPTWYPVWCGAVDVVIGAYLIWLSPRVHEGNIRVA